MAIVIILIFHIAYQSSDLTVESKSQPCFKYQDLLFICEWFPFGSKSVRCMLRSTPVGSLQLK